VAGVADRHGMSRSLLFEWRRQARAGTPLRVGDATSPPAPPAASRCAMATPGSPRRLRRGGGSNVMADRFQHQIRFRGIAPSYAFVAEPAEHG
jgi:hypothetical protein